jgi:hypothetical protein
MPNKSLNTDFLPAIAVSANMLVSRIRALAHSLGSKWAGQYLPFSGGGQADRLIRSDLIRLQLHTPPEQSQCDNSHFNTYQIKDLMHSEVLEKTG